MMKVWTADLIFENKYPLKVYRVGKNDITGMTNHSHEYVQIWYIAKGTCRHLVDETVYEMQTGSMLILPPKTNHNFECDDEELDILACDFMLEIVTEGLQRDIGENGYQLMRFAYLDSFIASIEKVNPSLELDAVKKLRIEEYLTKMLQVYTKQDKFYEIELKSYLLKLLVTVARDYEKTDRKKEKSIYKNSIKSCIEYIETHYAEKFTTGDMAKFCAMSESYFMFFFKELIGVTFVQYLNAFRIEKSKKLLTETDFSLEKIACLVGFQDVNYYNRVFKKTEKITPQQYRQREKS